MRRAPFHPSIFACALCLGLGSVSVLSGCGELTKPNDNQIRKDPDVKPANGAPQTGVMGAAQGQGAAAKGNAGNTGAGATGAQPPANAGPKPTPMVKPVVAPQPQANQPSCGG